MHAGLLRVLDHRQVSQLVVIAPVTVLSCTCSPPQRTGARWPPVWPLHSTCRRWNYTWKTVTTTSSDHVCPVSATANLCRNCLWRARQQVCSQGVQLTLAYVYIHMNIPHLPITCPQGKYMHAVLTNQHQSHMLLSSCIIACTSQKHSSEHSQSSPIHHLSINKHMQSCTHTQTDANAYTHMYVQAQYCIAGKFREV